MKKKYKTNTHYSSVFSILIFVRKKVEGQCVFIYAGIYLKYSRLKLYEVVIVEVYTRCARW